MGDTHTHTHTHTGPKGYPTKTQCHTLHYWMGTHTHIHTKRGRHTQDTKTPNICTKANIRDLLKCATYLLGGLKRPLHLQDFTSNVSQLKTNLSFHHRLMGHLSTQGEHRIMCPHNITFLSPTFTSSASHLYTQFLSIMFTSSFCPSHSHHQV